MFVVGDFREYVCACGFRCIDFSLWLNHCYDYHDSSFGFYDPIIAMITLILLFGLTRYLKFFF